MATKLVRKQVLITQEQNVRLKALAAETGCSEAELFREAVTQRLAMAESNDWRASWRAAAGMWKDYDELDERMKQIRGGWRRRQDRLFGGEDSDGGA